MKNVKGSHRKIDDLFNQLESDPLSAKGQASEIRTALDDIGASKIDEMAYRISDTQYKADILTKTNPVTGKQSLIEVKNSNSFSNYQDRLKEQLLAYNKYKPDADLTVYVRSAQVNDVNSWALNEFEFNVNVKSIPGT